MKLPNGDLAVIDRAKLRDYCLSPVHPQGKHKARLFAAALGLTFKQVDVLEELLRQLAVKEDATPSKSNSFGQFYEIRSTATVGHRSAILLSVWIVRTEEGFPRSVTCYPV